MAPPDATGGSQMAKGLVLKIDEGENGVWFATSEDSPPIFVAATNLDGLSQAIARVLQARISGRDAEQR